MGIFAELNEFDSPFEVEGSTPDCPYCYGLLIYQGDGKWTCVECGGRLDDSKPKCPSFSC